jgi:3-hydroxybutyrate dehydrogenase
MATSRGIFITGGTGSVGRHMVTAFAQAGYRVVFQFATNNDAARTLTSSTGAQGVMMDFGQPVSLAGQEIDVLVNNAGVNICGQPTASVSDKDWEQTLAINVTAAFRLIRSALPRMVAQQWGRIINISSICGLHVAENNLPYNVSKHALSALTKTVAKEYAAKGITSNEICPGPIESAMMRTMAVRETTIEGGTPEQWLQSVRSAIPAKRFAHPREIADVAVFLASDPAAYINGSSILMDGGLSA